MYEVSRCSYAHGKGTLLTSVQELERADAIRDLANLPVRKHYLQRRIALASLSICVQEGKTIHIECQRNARSCESWEALRYPYEFYEAQRLV
jgi:hypothetical protein